MTLVIVVYMMANVAYLGVLSPLQMLSSPAVAVVRSSSVQINKNFECKIEIVFLSHLLRRQWLIGSVLDWILRVCGF